MCHTLPESKVAYLCWTLSVCMGGEEGRRVRAVEALRDRLELDKTCSKWLVKEAGSSSTPTLQLTTLFLVGFG